MTYTAKVLTTPELAFLNERAVRHDLNRALSDEAIDALDPEGFHVVFMTMIHNDCEVRAGIMLKMSNRTVDDKPPEAWLDMSLEDFTAIREVSA